MKFPFSDYFDQISEVFLIGFGIFVLLLIYSKVRDYYGDN